MHLRDGNIIAAGGNEGLRLGQIGCGQGFISQQQLQEVLVEQRKLEGEWVKYFWILPM